ncbi:MAG: ChbG/HpnK family deacetylase [Thermodesulfobacteriota bacterium]
MRLVVNADDFGLCNGINEGVIRAFEQGLVRSASLMALGSAFPEAARYLKEHPGLDAGLHLTLTDEKPLTDARALFPGAWDSDRLPGMAKLFALLASSRADIAALEREIAAQMDKIRSAGISISHVDGHQHVHLFLRVFPLCLSLCRAHGISYLRTRITDRPNLRAGAGRLLQYAGLRLFLRAAVAPRTPPDLPALPCTGFLLSGGKMTVRDALDNLDALGTPPAAELILHPGLPGPAEEREYGHWNYAWENDLALACSQELARGLGERGIRPSGFRDLA